MVITLSDARYGVYVVVIAAVSAHQLLALPVAVHLHPTNIVRSFYKV